MSHSLSFEPKDGYIHLKVSGSLLETELPVFKKDLEDASRLIEKLYQEQGKKVKTLLDVSGFTGEYVSGSLIAFADFAKRNEPYIERTASFGGSFKVKMAGEAAIALSGRNNIKIFNNEEDAKAWLLV